MSKFSVFDFMIVHQFIMSFQIQVLLALCLIQVCLFSWFFKFLFSWDLPDFCSDLHQWQCNNCTIPRAAVDSTNCWNCSHFTQSIKVSVHKTNWSYRCFNTVIWGCFWAIQKSLLELVNTKAIDTKTSLKWLTVVMPLLETSKKQA